MEIERKIKKIIKKSSNIFICAHKNLDLDAIASCIGISCICRNYKKDNYIIIDDIEHEIGVSKVLEEINNSIKIIKSEEIPTLYKENSILIIVDVNKAQLLQNDKILHYFDSIIVLDHHQICDQTINTLSIIDEKYSSASEIVTNLIEKYKVKITEKEATILLAGIILDTNNFKVRVTPKAYYAAYYLSKIGANTKKAKYYLKEDLNDYIIRNKVIMGVEVFKDFAIAKTIDTYKREELAKIADNLLDFNNITASFVIGKRQDGGIGLSARSEGIVDVGRITSELGGGGDVNSAACHITDMTLDEVYKELKDILNKEE